MSSGRSAAFAEAALEYGDDAVRFVELVERRSAGDLLELDGLAYDLGIAVERVRQLLAIATRVDVDLLREVELLLCPQCGQLNPRDELQEEFEVEKEVTCRACSTSTEDLRGWDATTRYALGEAAAKELPQRVAMTVVILTAIRSEFEAVLGHLPEHREETHERGTIYRVGKFAGQRIEWTVGVGLAGRSNPSAAAEAERAIEHFEADVAMFVGVAGGIAEKGMHLGDVVAADEVHELHAGKSQPGEKGEPVFTPRQMGAKGSYSLRQRAQQEAISGDWVRRLDQTDAEPPRAMVEPIAAGSEVVTSTASESYRRIRDHYDRAVAIEIEGYGFLRALEGNEQARGLVIRGISDLLDDKREADAGGSQEMAAAHAAAFAFQVLSKLEL
jgi:nucleoside phosphorylase